MNPHSHPGNKSECRTGAQKSVIKTSHIMDWEKQMVEPQNISRMLPFDGNIPINGNWQAHT